VYKQENNNARAFKFHGLRDRVHSKIGNDEWDYSCKWDLHEISPDDKLVGVFCELSSDFIMSWGFLVLDPKPKRMLK
jgi:hypothetical protein